MRTIKTTINDLDIVVRGKEISIIGDYNSNHGRFYTENFDRWRNCPDDGNRPQIIGMDWDYGMTKSVKKWLCSLVIGGVL